MRFTKMQGLGNDYLYHYGDLENAAELAIRLSDRHFGIGSDGIITISPSAVADFQMRIFNADGSEAMMCGNGVRCVGKYVYDKGYTDKDILTIETKSGIKTLHLEFEDHKTSRVSVDMGKAEVKAPESLEVLESFVIYTFVSVGNPHAVIFVDDIKEAPVRSIGAAMEKHTAFPDGVNVEFVEPLEKNHLRMRVWERGSGITMACGTGACASAAAAIQRGYCEIEKPIRVDLDGGTLWITIASDYRVKMVGPAEIVAECDVASC